MRTSDSQRDPFWNARAKAAMLGAFNPAQLLNPTSEIDLPALKQLATECDEVCLDGLTSWILKPEIRFNVLQDAERDDLLELIADTLPAPEDRFGQMLQHLLRYGSTLKLLPMGDLGLLRSALQFIGPALDPVSVRTATQHIDLLLSRQDVEQAEQILLPRKLIGRKTELQKMQRYLRAPMGVAAEHIFWVTGVGGSGKSALLAELARKLRGKRWSGTPVLQIDFDRPAFYRGTLTSLMMELSRQLEMHFPHMEPALAAYRRAARLSVSDSEILKSVSFESINVREHEASSAWQQEMRQHLPISRKLVLFLDTAEEVGQSSNFDLAGLRRWLRQLRAREGLLDLRVVVSGRAFHSDQLALIPSRHRLELGDLAPADASMLLQSLLERKNARGDFPLAQLVNMIGGNPLSIKILAEHLIDGGESAANELLGDRTNFDRRFAQSFLYKRILGRLRTEEQDLVKVAHPGLVLRRVTPDLIRQVLAAPCGIGELDHARSRSLFRQLSGQVWLVQSTTNPDVVIHRRDLRRLMLQSMTVQDTARALEIHREAAEYYKRLRDPFMTPEEQAIEGLYHALFVPDTEFPTDDVLDTFARTLGEDLDTLPIRARAHVKLQLQRDLYKAEQQSLPAADLKLYRSMQRRKSLVLEGNSTPIAYNPAAPRQTTTGVDRRVLVSDLHAAFESGDLRTVARNSTHAVSAFADSLIRGHPEKNQADFTESAIWRAAMASMGHGTFVAALLETLPRVANRMSDHASIGASADALSVADAYNMLFRLHGADCPSSFSSSTVYRSLRLRTTQSLRRLQLLEEPQDTVVEIPVRLLRDLSVYHAALFEAKPRHDNIALDRSGEGDLNRLRMLRESNLGVTLSDLDQSSKRESTLTIYDAGNITPLFKDILIGRLPEVYVLVRVVARDCPLDVLVEFAAQAAQDRLWPVELGPNALRINLPEDRERWSATLIATVDRFGLLRSFVDWLEDRGRLKGRQQMLVGAVRTYELRLRQFI